MLTLLHDVVSCASLVAVLRLQELADQGAEISFVGLDLRGFDIALPPTLDVIEEFERHADTARQLGVPAHRPRSLPPTVAVHAIQDDADGYGLGAAWRAAAYRAFWEGGAELGDPDYLAQLGAMVGLDPVEVRAAATDRSRHAALRRRWQTWRGRGVGGVPVLVADGGTLLSPDRSDADLRALASL